MLTVCAFAPEADGLSIMYQQCQAEQSWLPRAAWDRGRAALLALLDSPQ